LPPALQLPPAQEPSRPQLAPSATHAPPTQQLVAIAQVEVSQQGWPSAPQATTEPATQAWPEVVLLFWPEARHVVTSQQPPPRQVLPEQQASPAWPQETQAPPVQMPPPSQMVLSAMHWCGPGSQHPALQ
jgi:hypothetical protein